MYNGRKVVVKEKYSYVDQETTPSFEGVVMETQRDQTGSVNGLYVLFIDNRGCGLVRQTSLSDVTFVDGEALRKDLESEGARSKDIFAQTLGMMLGGLHTMEA